MPIGISDDHVELARRLRQVGGLARRDRGCARGRGRPGADVRRASGRRVDEMGLPRIGLPSRPAAAAVRCSTSRSPSRRAPARWCRGRCWAPRSPRRCSASRRRPVGAGSAWSGSALGDVVWDAPVGHPPAACADGDGWCAGAARRRSTLTPALDPDLTRRSSLGRPATAARPCVAGLTDELVRRTCRHPGRRRGVRGRALVPGHGGRVRRRARAVRPEDRGVPGDQAPVRRDAGDRRVGHRGRVGRRLGRVRRDDEQWAFAADVAGAVAFDGAVRVAKDCIQVLGGIGFTFEHDAHLYLRRAIAPAQPGRLGRTRSPRALADLAAAGVRRRVERRPRRRATTPCAPTCATRSAAIAGAARTTAAAPAWPRPAT